MGITSLSQANAEAATGLVLVTTSSFSAASSVSVDNCFTSTYQHYRIVWNATAAAGGPAMSIRMRAASTDNTSANYAFQYLLGTTTTPLSARTTAATAADIAVVDSTGGWGYVEVARPAEAATTFISSYCGYTLTTPVTISYAAAHNVATAYDGFTLYPASSTITGTYWIYGYRTS